MPISEFLGNFNFKILIFLSFRLTFEGVPVENEDEEVEQDLSAVISVEPYVVPSRGPYVYNMPKKKKFCTIYRNTN